MPIVSQCPLCLTAFRVSELQIAAAEGLVRCGACGHIFDARLHRLGEPAPEEPAEPSAAELNQAYITDLFNEAPESVWEIEPTPGDADMWGDGASAPAEPVAESMSAREDAPGEREAPPAGAAADAMTTNEAVPGEATTAAPGPAAQLIPADEHPDRLDATGIPGASEHGEAAAIDTASTVSGDGGPGPGDNPDQAAAPQAVTPRIAPLPVEMERSSAGPRRARASLAWSLACTLAALVLAVQYVWFNRDQPRLRPLHESACRLFGCTVPMRRELHLIRLDALVIKPAAERADVLVAEAIITNRAAFPQGFPALELVFTDMDGHTVASRVFAADEYLEGGAGAGRVMGARESVSVRLTLMDPGEDATNYRVYLRESDPVGT